MTPSEAAVEQQAAERKKARRGRRSDAAEARRSQIRSVAASTPRGEPEETQRERASDQEPRRRREDREEQDDQDRERDRDRRRKPRLTSQEQVEAEIRQLDSRRLEVAEQFMRTMNRILNHSGPDPSSSAAASSRDRWR